jgi:hypothetical protein
MAAAEVRAAGNPESKKASASNQFRIIPRGRILTLSSNWWNLEQDDFRYEASDSCNEELKVEIKIYSHHELNSESNPRNELTVHHDLILMNVLSFTIIVSAIDLVGNSETDMHCNGQRAIPSNLVQLDLPALAS